MSEYTDMHGQKNIKNQYLLFKGNIHLLPSQDTVWPSGMQVNLHPRRSSAQSDINQVSHWYNNSPDDGHMAARNM